MNNRLSSENVLYLYTQSYLIWQYNDYDDGIIVGVHCANIYVYWISLTAVLNISSFNTLSIINNYLLIYLLVVIIFTIYICNNWTVEQQYLYIIQISLHMGELP